MAARTKLETFEETFHRKLTAAEAYANRPRNWMLYTLIVLIIVAMVGWSSSSVQYNGMTVTGSEVAKGVLHGVFHPDTALLFGTGETDVPYLLLQPVAIAVLGTPAETPRAAGPTAEQDPPHHSPPGVGAPVDPRYRTRRGLRRDYPVCLLHWHDLQNVHHGH